MNPTPSSRSPPSARPQGGPSSVGGGNGARLWPAPSLTLPFSRFCFGFPGKAGLFSRPVEPTVFSGNGKLGWEWEAVVLTLDFGGDSGLFVAGEEGEGQTASFLVKRGTFFFNARLRVSTPVTLGLQSVGGMTCGVNWH